MSSLLITLLIEKQVTLCTSVRKINNREWAGSLATSPDTRLPRRQRSAGAFFAEQIVSEANSVIAILIVGEKSVD